MPRSDDPRPLLLVDVDGTLNVQPGPRRPEGDWQVHRAQASSGIEYTLHIDPRFGEWLNGLADQYELAWCTTWGDVANERISPLLGLPEDMPVVPLPDTLTDVPISCSAKTRHVRAWASGRAVAWIDDDIDERDAVALKQKETPDGSRPLIAALTLNVDPDIGITEWHIETLKAWSPGAEAQSDLREENWRRIETEWVMLTAAEVQARLGTSDDPASIGLLAVERPYGLVYPAFQLVEAEDGSSRVAPAWTKMMLLLAPAEWEDHWVLLWGASVSGWLQGRTPADEIQEHPDEVTRALRIAVDRAIPDVAKKRWAERAVENEPR